MFANLRRNIVDKGFARAEPLGNVHALLPATQLVAIELLESSEVLQVLVFVIVIIEVQVAHLIESTRELAPGTLPLCIASLAASTS